ncbi:head GIN domain-containing protein [Ulvibacterium marinum]|uniref:DUF2807 domain-containing protein n=1 Tax=Ulvibacterium marinum TaxID=2419782 RepID=A0A3B0BYM6_9FLAO|nr:head GIN domain-containing protein [Ulvibacterium marinum]RKN78703.1 DUF2807 domain-containing protein [Ulvibacterium marinum]
MKIKMILPALILSSAFGFAQNTTIDLANFDELKVYDQLSVKLVKSDKNQAVISGDDQDEVAIVNNDGLLKVRMEVDNALDGKTTDITLYYTDNLSLIDANENSKITSEDIINTKYLTVRAQEGGEITLKLDSRNLDSKAVTGGKIMVDGSATNQEITVRTGGHFAGKGLKTETTDVTILAGGTAFISASDYVDASVTAGGTVEIFGNPEKILEDKTFGGSIIVRK